MKLGRLNHIGIATQFIADSIPFGCNGVRLPVAPSSRIHYNDLIM
jgi:hypothetical protein